MAVCLYANFLPLVDLKIDLDLKQIYHSVTHMRYEYERKHCAAHILVNMRGQATFIRDKLSRLLPAATRINIEDVIEWQKAPGDLHWRPLILKRQALKLHLQDTGLMSELLPSVTDYDGHLADILSDSRSEELRQYLGFSK